MCVGSPQQTRAGAVDLQLVNSHVFSYSSGQARANTPAMRFFLYVFSCKVAVQIMTDKGCYLKAPALHCISKALLFGAFAHRKAATRGARCTDPEPHFNPFVKAAVPGTRSRLLQVALPALGICHEPGSSTPFPWGLVMPVLMV